jgi:Fe-S cluster assembly scaffold protein SufB
MEKELLQRLWDAYAELVQKIVDTMNMEDAEEILSAVDEACTDTPEVAQLREDLKQAGVVIKEDV